MKGWTADPQSQHRKCAIMPSSTIITCLHSRLGRPGPPTRSSPGPTQLPGPPKETHCRTSPVTWTRSGWRTVVLGWRLTPAYPTLGKEWALTLFLSKP